MKSISLKRTQPVDATGPQDARYFIDGKRVGKKRYNGVRDNAVRHDTFQTVRAGRVYRHHSVTHIAL